MYSVQHNTEKIIHKNNGNPSALIKSEITLFNGSENVKVNRY